MSRYRDDRETVEARLAQVEQRLATAQSTVARLRGDVGPAPTDEPGAAPISLITGAPTHTRLRRVLPFNVSGAGIEALRRLYAQHLPHEHGVTETWRDGLLAIDGVDGQLTLRARGPLASELCVATTHRGIALLHVALSLVPLGVTLPLLRELGASPLTWAVAAPLSVFVALLGLRPFSKRLVLSHRRKLTGLFEAAADVAALHATGGVQVATHLAQPEIEHPHEGHQEHHLAEEVRAAGDERTLG